MKRHTDTNSKPALPLRQALHKRSQALGRELADVPKPLLLAAAVLPLGLLFLTLYLIRRLS